MNKVILMGRLTKDVELKFTPNGVAVATGTLAVNRRFKNQQTGEREADFINIVIWRQPAENAANMIGKGCRVSVVGYWQTRNFEGQDGKRVYVNECVVEEIDFIDYKDNGQGNQGQQQQQGGQQQRQNNQGNTNGYQGQQNRGGGQQGGNGGGYNGNQRDPFANNDQPIDISDDDLPF